MKTKTGWKVHTPRKYKGWFMACLRHENGTIHTISCIPHGTKGAAMFEAKNKLDQWEALPELEAL